MKKLSSLVAVLAILVAGCAGSTPNDAHAKQEEKVLVNTIVQCGKTSHSKQAFTQCLVPPGHGRAFQRCVLDAVKGAHVVFPKGRIKLAEAIVACGEQNR